MVFPLIVCSWGECVVILPIDQMHQFGPENRWKNIWKKFFFYIYIILIQFMFILVHFMVYF